jgi:hypothetical protein
LACSSSASTPTVAPISIFTSTLSSSSFPSKNGASGGSSSLASNLRNLVGSAKQLQSPVGSVAEGIVKSLDTSESESKLDKSSSSSIAAGTSTSAAIAAVAEAAGMMVLPLQGSGGGVRDKEDEEAGDYSIEEDIDSACSIEEDEELQQISTSRTVSSPRSLLRPPIPVLRSAPINSSSSIHNNSKSNHGKGVLVGQPTRKQFEKYRGTENAGNGGSNGKGISSGTSSSGSTATEDGEQGGGFSNYNMRLPKATSNDRFMPITVDDEGSKQDELSTSGGVDEGGSGCGEGKEGKEEGREERSGERG